MCWAEAALYASAGHLSFELSALGAEEGSARLMRRQSRTKFSAPIHFLEQATECTSPSLIATFLPRCDLSPPEVSLLNL